MYEVVFPNQDYLVITDMFCGCSRLDLESSGLRKQFKEELDGYNKDHIAMFTKLFKELDELWSFRDRVLAEENDHGSLAEALRQRKKKTAKS